MMDTVHGYLDNGLPIIRGISERFYRGDSAETWAQFGQFLEGLQWVVEACAALEQAQTANRVFAAWHSLEADLSDLGVQIRELMGAVETRDPIRIADLIGYEIVPVLSRIQEHIRLTQEGAIDHA
jgi:hypothetical protein